MNSTARQTSLDFLHKILGTPYEEKDCWEVVKFFYLNYFKIDLSEYDIIPQDRKTNAVQIKRRQIYFDRIDNQDTNANVFIKSQIGDILLFSVLGYNSHVGIYLNEHQFLHSSIGIDCVIDRLHNWKKRIRGIYRWPKLD